MGQSPAFGGAPSASIKKKFEPEIAASISNDGRYGASLASNCPPIGVHLATRRWLLHQQFINTSLIIDLIKVKFTQFKDFEGILEGFLGKLHDFDGFLKDSWRILKDFWQFWRIFKDSWTFSRILEGFLEGIPVILDDFEGFLRLLKAFEGFWRIY